MSRRHASLRRRRRRRRRQRRKQRSNGGGGLVATGLGDAISVEEEHAAAARPASTEGVVEGAV